MELKHNERKRKRFVEKSTGIVLNGGDRLGNSTAMRAKGTAYTSLVVEKCGLGEETIRKAESSIGIA